jgi:hypothetical protein
MPMIDVYAPTDLLPIGSAALAAAGAAAKK